MSNRKFASLDVFLTRAASQRTLLFSLLLVGALLAFEIFNYSTTEFAMADLLGNLTFAGMRWSTILALAFCGIDFAGIARLFTPEQGFGDIKETWYLFGAWLLAATMNATLTWWGVSIALLQHSSLGSAVIPRETLLKSVPVFVALMVWLSRVLIIGTFSVAGESIFAKPHPRTVHRAPRVMVPPTRSQARPTTAFQPNLHTTKPAVAGIRPAPKPDIREDGYTPMPLAAKSNQSDRVSYS